MTEQTGDEYLTVAQLAERLKLDEQNARLIARRMAARKHPEAVEVDGEFRVAEAAVARMQSGQLDLPWRYRVWLWLKAHRVDHRLRNTIFIVGALGSALGAILALATFFDGRQQTNDDATATATEQTPATADEDAAGNATADAEPVRDSGDGAASELELDVDYLWPLPSTTCEGYPMAMVDDVTLDQYESELTLAEDPRLTALRLGGVPYGHEQLSMTIRNPSETPAYIRRLEFPVARSAEDGSIEPSWIVYSAKGCGGPFGGVPVDYLRYDLDENRLVAALADGTTAEVGSAPGLDFFGTEITVDSPFFLSVEVAACVGLHSWTVRLEYEIGGEIRTLTIPDDGEEPFRLLGSTHDGPTHVVAGSREPPGRDIQPSPDSAEEIARAGGKTCL